MCTVLLPPGVNPIAVNKYIKSPSYTEGSGTQFLKICYMKLMLEWFKWHWQVLQPAFTRCINTLTNGQTANLDTEDNSRYGMKY